MLFVVSVYTIGEHAGMHGAALAWSLLMPPGTALLELWPHPGTWRLYEHIAEWAGMLYRCTTLHSLAFDPSIVTADLSIDEEVGFVRGPKDCA